jgi:NAD(P)-dependent dehydrogenase (short-subunit alcohol dehydrogenase family)
MANASADPAPPLSLAGKVAIVTGAGSGLGRAYAQQLAAAGASVVVNDLGVPIEGGPGDPAPGRQVAEEIGSAGGRAIAHFGDVSDWDDVTTMVGAAIETFGGLDIVVNNAGIMTPTKIVPDLEIAEYDRMLAVHLRGAVSTTIQATRYWRDEYRRSGIALDRSIVNISSTSFLTGAPWRANYAVAKAGVATLTVGTASGCGWFGVRANAICPSAFGRMTAYSPPGSEAAMADKAPEDNAPLVVALASAASAAITGQLFTISGQRIKVIGAPQVIAEFAVADKWTAPEVARQLGEHFATEQPGYGWPHSRQWQEVLDSIAGR